MNKLIKLKDDHYVVVNDSEIKEACYVYKHDENVYNTGIFYLPADANFAAFNEEKSISKVTHSTIPIPYTEQGSLDELIEICKTNKMNKETLEKVAEKYCLIHNIPIDQMIVKNDRSCEFETPPTMFIKGAKWQQKRSYSEEDMRLAINKARDISDGKDCFDAEDISGCTEVCTYDWKFNMSEDSIIEQFKKK